MFQEDVLDEELSKQVVKRHSAAVSTTLAECKKCFKWVADSGMTKHLKHCTGTVKDTPSSGAVPAQISTRDAVPKAATESGTDLTYNPERLREVTREIRRMEDFWEVKSDLLSLSEDEIKKKYNEPNDLDQDSTMKFLFAMTLVAGNGQRGNTIPLMKIKEYERAKRQEQDAKVVFCGDNKTKTTSRAMD